MKSDVSNPPEPDGVGDDDASILRVASTDSLDRSDGSDCNRGSRVSRLTPDIEAELSKAEDARPAEPPMREAREAGL